MEFQVQSDAGADGSGNVTVENGVMFEGSFVAQYESVQVSGASDPSICEVFFVISSLQVRMLYFSVIVQTIDADVTNIKYWQY